jgi:hypothetical protein
VTEVPFLAKCYTIIAQHLTRLDASCIIVLSEQDPASWDRKTGRQVVGDLDNSREASYPMTLTTLDSGGDPTRLGSVPAVLFSTSAAEGILSARRISQ